MAIVYWMLSIIAVFWTLILTLSALDDAIIAVALIAASLILVLVFMQLERRRNNICRTD